MKRYLKMIIVLLGAALYLTSCKKSNETIFTPSGAINITSAVVGGAGSLDFNGPGQNVYNFSYVQYPVLAGQSPVNIYAPAVVATLTTPASPEVTYYNKPLNVTNVGNYSLFLAGLSPSAIDAVLIKETYTETYPDSVCGVRFINISPDSNPISVDIQGNTNGSEVASLAYKAYSGFTQLSAKSAAVNNGINFEIRDVASGNVVATYTLTPIPTKNVTIALAGSEASPSVIQVNN